MHAPPFSRLADVYDAIMADVEYDDWIDFILREASARGFRGGRLLDLGCGTGNATGPALARGHRVDGLDASAAMLEVARRKHPAADFVVADMRDFAVPARYALVYSVFDALNNLLSDEAFLAMARRVLAHLEPGGLFVFDANTTTGLRTLWEDGRAEGWAGDVYYRWLHRFDETSGLATVEAYCRDRIGEFTEVHQERPYDVLDLERLLRQAGFAAVEVVRYPDARPADPDEPRVWTLARAPGGASGSAVVRPG